LIERNPENILGKTAADKFEGRLPYLFKVLAAAKPLSIQAHPNLVQAKDGFEKENRLKISLDAPSRNYKDDNHKPECICALTDFWAMKGFRKIPDILLLMEKINPEGLGKELDNLNNNQNSQGLKSFFQAMLKMGRERRQKVIADAIANAKKNADDHPVYEWMISLYNEYPADIGVFSPIILNLICLKPGQAMFLPAGELHAYLDGVGIELMANSDNVLRGGLTPKHVDVPELLKVLNFTHSDINILPVKKRNDCEQIYPSRAEEFELSMIDVKAGRTYFSPTERSVEILLCTAGGAIVADLGKNKQETFAKGTSIIVPAVVDKYRIEGNATIYKAGVPI
jgi:mannose-6-phosphate isomerase